MKKILIIIALLLCFTGCTMSSNESSKSTSSGVWISYSELNSMLLSENGFKAEFENVISNLRQLKIQNLYLHVRAFGDSLYKSNYFPLMKAVEGYDFDVLEYVISESHKNGIKLHAWINPYRVLTSSSDIEVLNTESPAYKWIKDEIPENDRNVCFSNGIYFNPAELQVQRLVIDGIKEILNNYKVDGIHFDDYFYPTTEKSFDEISYNEYLNGNANPLSLEDWRRNNVNSLISSCNSTIKHINKDIIFSVSPMASIEQNYNNLYADVVEWINGGYLDYIIPQLYFGFEYPEKEFRFDSLITDWKKITSEGDVDLIIGLANYKAIPELENDREEWENNFDIIGRQVKICKQDDAIKGYVFFSYSSLFGNEEPFAKQRENIKLVENING